MSNYDLLYKIRHSLAHILAQAVLEIRPDSKLGFGPPIDNGLYYDFILSSPLHEEDFPQIEERMRKIIRSKPLFIREELSIADGLKRINEMGEPYKREFAEELARRQGVDKISFYRSGGFQDMCDGPHVANAGEIPIDSFKIRSLAGAYWRGDSANAMMSRVYVWAFANKKDLDEAILAHEEALKRDHRKLGRELEIFAFDEEVGPGLPLWLPNGTAIRDELEKFIKEIEFKAGYHRVSTPHIARESLFQKSGHLAHYASDMFPPMLLNDSSQSDAQSAKQAYYLRPMNCPHHHRIFASRPRSYRELPLRLAEYGQIYRYEESGALLGLMRARGCCQNDAHIYCSREQIRAEMLSILKMYKEAYAVLEISEYRLRLSKWDPQDAKRSEKYVDAPELWQWSQDLLRSILVEADMPFFEADGEAAFYGPKIDVQFRTISGREETASTIQLDFSSAERVDLNYIGNDGQEHRPFIIHRAPLGSHERFIAFLIEKYAGAFPLWLAPLQVRILPLADRHVDYAQEVASLLRGEFVRVEVDASGETLQKRVRNAALMKIPYVLVVGDKEKVEDQVAVRMRGDRAQLVHSVHEFASMMKEKIQRRELNLELPPQKIVSLSR